jgi:cell division protein FtsQ
MRRWLTFVLGLALAVAMGGAFSRIPEALAEVQAFKVAEVRLRGARFLTHEEALAALDLSPSASVWDDTKALEARLEEHPLVKDVTVHRRFPDALLLRLVEREPVALFPNPTLEPVDEDGRILPIDPAAHKLDLPIMAFEGREGPGSLSTADLRLMAGEISRLAHLYPRGEMRARIGDPHVTLRFLSGLPSGRIQTGMRVLMDARRKFGEGDVMDLDLRYEDQVVVRFSRAEGN